MTNTDTTRRDVLKTTASATIVGGIATTTGTATSGRTGHIVEAGIRYEPAERQNWGTSIQNSRPPYTVDRSKGNFLVSPTAGLSGDLVDRIAESGALFAEMPVGPGESRGMGGKRSVSTLPLGLTSRMRPRAALALADENTLPAVKLTRSGNDAKLVVKGGPTRRITPGTEQAVRLETETVTVNTVHTTGEKAEDDDIPAYRLANKKQYGTKEIDVTPVVEVTHQGELELVPREIA